MTRTKTKNEGDSAEMGLTSLIIFPSSQDEVQITLESISSTFYARLFRTNVLRETFLYLDLRFVLLWRKNIGANAALTILVKLTPGGNPIK